MDTLLTSVTPETLTSGMPITVPDLADTTRRFDSTMSPRALGEAGEEHAAAWLHDAGWLVLARNFRSRYGELDIVALDPERVIVFVEVKTRRTMRLGTPQEAVTHAKRTNLRRAGVQWLLDAGRTVAHRGVRFDVVTVTVHDGAPVIHHIKGAF